MERPCTLVLLILTCLLIGVNNANAVAIDYQRTNLGGNTWRNDYLVFNNSFSGAIEEFTIIFDNSFYGNLRSPLAPFSFDAIVVQPDINIPDDGFYDALALNEGIPQGEKLGGFSVLYDHTGPSLPGSQNFFIVDRMNPSINLYSGFTTLVPEPDTFVIMAIGAVVALFRYRRLKKR